MSSRVAYYFATFVVILTHNMIFPVKGQCTVQGCENEDSWINIVAEVEQLFVQANRQLQKEQVQYIHALLNASFQQMKNQHDTVMTSLQAVDRRLDEHDASIKNQTQNLWKLAIGIPVQLEIAVDLGEDPILLPIVNNWIVLMHRFDGSLNFYRNWAEYKNGFGEIERGEFWLGNEKIHRLTNRFVFTLRIEVQLNATGRWYYADYSTFSLDSESNKYALRVSGYSGNAGDSLTNTSLETYGYHGGMSFSTWDNENGRNPTYKCAADYRTGWWLNACFHSCLTCPYDKDFKWFYPSGWQTSGLLRAARMMIKSK